MASETEARTAKATLIADAWQSSGLTADDLQTALDSTRLSQPHNVQAHGRLVLLEVLRAASGRSPDIQRRRHPWDEASNTTWRQVLDLLHHREGNS